VVAAVEPFLHQQLGLKEMAGEVAALLVDTQAHQVLLAEVALQVAIEQVAAVAALEKMDLLLVTVVAALYYCVSPIAILLLFLVAFPVLFIIQKVVITFI
jgi:hypothetical protein